jgi:hypothetical protein
MGYHGEAAQRRRECARLELRRSRGGRGKRLTRPGAAIAHFATLPRHKVGSPRGQPQHSTTALLLLAAVSYRTTISVLR